MVGMRVAIQRTEINRMTDMYKITFLPCRTRIVAFTNTEFERLFPEIKMGRGEKIFGKIGLTREENGV